MPEGDPCAIHIVGGHLDGDAVAAALEAAKANRGPFHDDTDPVDRMPYPRRLGEAFCAFLEGVDPRSLPVHGGSATALLVSIDLEDLHAERALRGELICGASACVAHLLAVILAVGHLEQGSTRGTHTAELRTAERQCRHSGP